MKPVIDSVSDEITFRSEKNEYDVVMRKSAVKRQTLLLTILVIAVVTMIVWTMNSLPPSTTTGQTKNAFTQTQAAHAACLFPKSHTMRLG